MKMLWFLGALLRGKRLCSPSPPFSPTKFSTRIRSRGPGKPFIHSLNRACLPETVVAGTSLAFALKIIELLLGPDKAKQVAAPMMLSFQS
jgi:hypothetical protein